MLIDYYGSEDALAAGSALLIGLISVAVCVATLIGLWKIFQKAGYQGWESIIPFYNTYVLCDIVFGNGLLFLITFVPYVNVVFIYIIYFKLAGVFNKSTAYGLGLVFLSPIFIIMLGFDPNAFYSGPSVKARSMNGGYGSFGGGYGNNYGGGYGNFGGNQNFNNNSGYNNDYPTYGGNNPQGYGTPQQNGYQNNGFQSQGQAPNNGFQAQGFQRSNPFEQPNNSNSYNSYNNPNNNNF